MEVSPFVTAGKEDFGGYAEGIPGDIQVHPKGTPYRTGKEGRGATAA